MIAETESSGGTADPIFGFVGVSTSGSSIMRIFPRWAEMLNLPTKRIAGYDLPLDASDADYRALVATIRDDPNHLGVLVTTHKIRLYEATVHLFDELDEFARLCGELSSISKRKDRLVGHAKDPISAGLTLEEFLPPGHFAATSAEVVCFGAGGAATALTWYLARRADRPARITCTDTSLARLAHLRDVHGRGSLEPNLFRYELVTSAADSDRLIAMTPAASLVVNATGLGKDRPGSPLSSTVAFPERALVWELNYRGSLDFLHQARSQREACDLTVVDGWRYFIYGWTQVIAEVFHIDINEPMMENLTALAEHVR